jgi:predicted nucleic acid-binding protein
MAFIADASMTLAWFMADEATADTRAVRELIRRTSLVVPAVWPLEIANALIGSERCQRLTRSQTERIGQLLGRLPIEIEPVDLVVLRRQTLPLAREHGLSIYDATYLELAVRRGLALATLDARMVAAAHRLGVVLVQVMPGNGQT